MCYSTPKLNTWYSWKETYSFYSNNANVGALSKFEFLMIVYIWIIQIQSIKCVFNQTWPMNYDLYTAVN